MNNTYNLNSFQLILLILIPVFMLIGYIIYDKSQNSHQTIVDSNQDSQNIQIIKEPVKNDTNHNTYAVADGSSLKFDINFRNIPYVFPQWDLMCLPRGGKYCENNICKDIKPTVFLLVDMKNQSYYRCDQKSCDAYQYTSKSIEGDGTAVSPIGKSGGFILFGNLYDRQSQIGYSESVYLLGNEYSYYGGCVWN